MINAYVSPGQNALNWLKDKAVDPIMEKTFEPGFLEAVEHVNSIFDIQWGSMFLQLIQIGTLGVCAMVIIKAFGLKEIGILCLWLTVVECVAVVMRTVMG